MAIVTALGLGTVQTTARRTAVCAVPIAPPTRRLHILLAEDNQINEIARGAAHMLEKAGRTVVVATNGEEAVVATGGETFDLVLMDVQMPVMDGFQATSRIRRREQHTGGRVPIVAMTAHAVMGDRERCLEAGMDGYVTKPIRKAELFSAIAVSIAQSGPGALVGDPVRVDCTAPALRLPPETTDSREPETPSSPPATIGVAP